MTFLEDAFWQQNLIFDPELPESTRWLIQGSRRFYSHESIFFCHYLIEPWRRVPKRTLHFTSHGQYSPTSQIVTWRDLLWSAVAVVDGLSRACDPHKTYGFQKIPGHMKFGTTQKAAHAFPYVRIRWNTVLMTETRIWLIVEWWCVVCCCARASLHM